MYNRCKCNMQPNMHQPNVYQMPCIEPKVINKYHVECERVEVPVVTQVIHHKIKKPQFVYIPVCEEQFMEHPFVIEDNCCTPRPTLYQNNPYQR